MTPEEEAYKRGKLDATVEAHTKHLDKINGTLEMISKQLADAAQANLLASQQAASRDAIAVKTAQTVKDTRQEAIDKSVETWKPWQKVSIAVLTLAAAIAGVIALIHEFQK